MSEVHSKRVYTFHARYGHHLHMSAAELRNTILNLGSKILGSEYTVEVISEEENTIEVRCEAATGELVYEMDSKLIYKILNYCEKHNLDFSVGDMLVKTPDMDEWT